MNTEKMKKAACNLDVVVKIVGGIFGAVAWVLVAVGVLVLLLGEQMYDMGVFTLDLEYVKLYLTKDVPVELGRIQIGIAAGLFVGGVVCFLVARGAKLVRRIFASMKEGRPFDLDAPANLRKIAWLWLIGGTLLQVWVLADQVMMTRALPMEQIFAAPVIEKVEYFFTFDFNFVWVAIVILFLSYVFDYGQKLQVESDETL